MSPTENAPARNTRRHQRNKQVTGIFFESKVDYTTWFGANVEYIHGIQVRGMDGGQRGTKTPTHGARARVAPWGDYQAHEHPSTCSMYKAYGAQHVVVHPRIRARATSCRRRCDRGPSRKGVGKFARAPGTWTLVLIHTSRFPRWCGGRER